MLLLNRGHQLEMLFSTNTLPTEVHIELKDSGPTSGGGNSFFFFRNHTLLKRHAKAPSSNGRFDDLHYAAFFFASFPLVCLVRCIVGIFSPLPAVSHLRAVFPQPARKGRLLRASVNQNLRLRSLQFHLAGGHCMPHQQDSAGDIISIFIWPIH